MGAFLGGCHFAMSWEQLARNYQQANFFPNQEEPLGRGHVNYLKLFCCLLGALHVGATARRAPCRFAN
jgi:hypothetical protein